MKYQVKLAAFVGLALALPAMGSTSSTDDFKRESGDRPAKDAMEGQPPPALEAEGWLNTDGQPLDWAALRGKVVVLDFWGTW